MLLDTLHNDLDEPRGQLYPHETSVAPMSKRAAADTSSIAQASSSAGDSSIVTPASTPSETSQRGSSIGISGFRTDQGTSSKMDDEQQKQTAGASDEQEVGEGSADTGDKDQAAEVKKVKTPKKKCHKSKHKKLRKAVKKSKEKGARNDTGSSSDSSSDDDEDEESEESEDERAKRKAKKAKQLKKASKTKKRRKAETSESEESSESEDEDESSDDEPKKKAKKTKAAKKAAKDKKRKGKKSAADSDDEGSDSDDDDSSPDEKAARKKKKSAKKSKKSSKVAAEEESESEDDDGVDNLEAQVASLKLKLSEKKLAGRSTTKRRRSSDSSPKSKRKSSKSKDAPDFKRVDQLWDSTIHNYKLKESAEDDETEFAEYAFLVRRCFNWENKYTETVVDIKSKTLRAVLAEVMKECKSVSLEAEEPTIDPNILFLYLEELRTYYKKTLKSKIKTEKKRKNVKKLELQKTLCKTLVTYIDEDYADTKKTLYPLLEAGNITFDLLWALFKPNEVAFTSCYGAWDEPRCFKVEYANKFSTMQRGEWYCIEGKYMEYDGKGFGYGDFEVDVDAFKGPRKISSLATYPLKYHKDPAGIKKKIVERGQQFVSMEGMQYKFHKGLAFMKKKKQVAKININGRVMIDPATFRRINPNYPISFIKPKDSEELFSDSDDEDSDKCSCCDDSDDENAVGGKERDLENEDHSDDVPKFKYKWVEDEHGCPNFVAVEVDENGDPIRSQRLENLSAHPDLRNRTFSEEELLLTSPVVLGFAFSEKLWLEFSLSGVREIEWNESAYDSLVLPPNQKDIVSALVKSHKFNAAKTIDDVVQGKGKGLVAVLHGPPGTGKTLTAEGISELLKCPLYMVSAGELGTDPARLEHELQKILDIAHSWGAVLLLDEADVFLEKREVHDIHRNALVSIFLRLLEYFQGILFLTTNRVETFDDAFQSRIHIALRYGELTNKAKKTVWKMFIELVRKQEMLQLAETGTPLAVNFSDHDLEMLSRHQLNGRQIKNAVRTAQALALNEAQALTMEHVKRVLDVAETFDRDLKGGTGYVEAMRSYT